MKAKFTEVVDYLVAHGLFLEEAVELLEQMVIEKTLEKTGGNQLQAARLLGIHRNTLRRKLEAFRERAEATRPKPVTRAGRASKRRAS